MPGIAVQGAIGSQGQKPATRFTGFDFNSLCEINGVSIAAGSEGLSVLNTGDKDGAVSFESSVEFATSDFGVQQYKRIRFIYVGFVGKLTFNVSAVYDKDKEKTITINPGKEHLQRSRHSFFNDSGRYIKFKITTAGYLRIDDLRFLLIARHSGHKGY